MIFSMLRSARAVMVTNGLTATDILSGSKKLNFPRSIVEMMQGYLGQPEGGWPKALQKIILDSAGAKPIHGRPGSAVVRGAPQRHRAWLATVHHEGEQAVPR